MHLPIAYPGPRPAEKLFAHGKTGLRFSLIEHRQFAQVGGKLATDVLHEVLFIAGFASLETKDAHGLRGAEPVQFTRAPRYAPHLHASIRLAIARASVLEEV